MSLSQSQKFKTKCHLSPVSNNFIVYLSRCQAGSECGDSAWLNINTGPCSAKTRISNIGAIKWSRCRQTRAKGLFSTIQGLGNSKSSSALNDLLLIKLNRKRLLPSALIYRRRSGLNIPYILCCGYGQNTTRVAGHLGFITICYMITNCLYKMKYKYKLKIWSTNWFTSSKFFISTINQLQ